MALIFDTILNNQRPYWLQFLYLGQMHVAAHTYSILSGGGVAYLQVKTVSDLIHLFGRTIVVEGGGPIIVELIENPTITDGTIEPTVISNLDRRSTKAPTVSLFINPTGISGGTVIDLELIATGGGPKTSAALSGGDTERVLDYNSDYLLRMTNIGSQDSEVNLHLVWYESGN